MIAKINQLLEEVAALKAANAEELEALRIKYLSKKGAINDLMADFRNVAAEQKKEVGMRLNELKTKAQEKINALKEQFDNQDNGQDDLDLTRSAYPVELYTLSLYDALPISEERRVGKECTPSARSGLYGTAGGQSLPATRFRSFPPSNTPPHGQTDCRMGTHGSLSRQNRSLSRSSQARSRHRQGSFRG